AEGNDPQLEVLVDAGPVRKRVERVERRHGLLVEAQAETHFGVTADSGQPLAAHHHAIELADVEVLVAAEGREKLTVLKQHVLRASSVETGRREAADKEIHRLLGRSRRRRYQA